MQRAPHDRIGRCEVRKAVWIGDQAEPLLAVEHRVDQIERRLDVVPIERLRADIKRARDSLDALPLRIAST